MPELEAVAERVPVSVGDDARRQLAAESLRIADQELAHLLVAEARHERDVVRIGAEREVRVVDHRPQETLVARQDVRADQRVGCGVRVGRGRSVGIRRVGVLRRAEAARRVPPVEDVLREAQERRLHVGGERGVLRALVQRQVGEDRLKLLVEIGALGSARIGRGRQEVVQEALLAGRLVELDRGQVPSIEQVLLLRIELGLEPVGERPVEGRDRVRLVSRRAVRIELLHDPRRLRSRAREERRRPRVRRIHVERTRVRPGRLAELEVLAALDPARHAAVLELQALKEVEVPQRLVEQVRQTVVGFGNVEVDRREEVRVALHELDHLIGGFQVLRAPVPVARVVPTAPGVGHLAGRGSSVEQFEGQALGPPLVEAVRRFQDRDRGLQHRLPVVGVERAGPLPVGIFLLQRDAAALVVEAPRADHERIEPDVVGDREIVGRADALHLHHVLARTGQVREVHPVGVCVGEVDRWPPTVLDRVWNVGRRLQLDRARVDALAGLDVAYVEHGALVVDHAVLERLVVLGARRVRPEPHRQIRRLGRIVGCETVLVRVHRLRPHARRIEHRRRPVERPARRRDRDRVARLKLAVDAQVDHVLLDEFLSEAVDARRFRDLGLAGEPFHPDGGTVQRHGPTRKVVYGRIGGAVGSVGAGRQRFDGTAPERVHLRQPGPVRPHHGADLDVVAKQPPVLDDHVAGLRLVADERSVVDFAREEPDPDKVLGRLENLEFLHGDDPFFACPRVCVHAKQGVVHAAGRHFA